jgi:two-component system, NtrC family, sensor kinase
LPSVGLISHVKSSQRCVSELAKNRKAGLTHLFVKITSYNARERVMDGLSPLARMPVLFRLRSIRRKLAVSLTLAIAMLLVQLGGGMFGLLSYRQVVKQLDSALSDEPRPGDVAAAISLVFEPLDLPAGPSVEARNYRNQLIAERLVIAQGVVAEFHRRIEQAKMPPDQRFPTMSVVYELDRQLNELLKSTQADAPAAANGPTDDELRRQVARLQLSAMAIPQPRSRVEQLLVDARSTYGWCLWIVGITGWAAVVLFLGLGRSLYNWVLMPIRLLHQGASRVALGDFSFRVQIRGVDEMAQLAERFNSMTARFEEIKSRLDREVHERSKQLLRSERLAGVGFLAAGVAHEINNPLSAISMAAESLEGRLQDSDARGEPLQGPDLTAMRQYLGMIQREAFRCQQITQRLLGFARGQDVGHTRCDLVKIITEVLDMVRHMSRFRGYDIHFNQKRTVWLDVNGAEMKQVVLNLVANALESMEGSGRLDVDILEYADEIVLTFADTGCGMTPHVLEHLFEPFFTERKSGKGTGLGLSISHRIVSDHGGRIEASSPGPGQGSVFRVHLPRVAVQSLTRAA